MRDRCDKHGITDCVMCMMQAARKVEASQVYKAPGAHELAPAAVTGGPPADIEGFDSTIPGEPATAQKSAVVVFEEPTDDSRASQVMRKAATYAKAAAEYAKHLASVEKIKVELVQAQFKLDDAVAAKDSAETELKKLVSGGE